MAAKEAKPETKSYKALLAGRHDGKGYVAGAILELTAEQADHLLKLHAIQKAPVKAAE